ncbi:hypothetical protein [Azospirillum sp.]|uniref:hypothetical protein n=1 Tax=Azospirillum sp. TaxID=34012 RepID=UPI003D74B2CC
MLRVTVTRETATDAEPIAEVVIGKFAGGEKRAGYAARVYEPPSPYSEGVDACFEVRGHERYQPAFALVAAVLGAWREGRVDEVGDGVRAALTNALGSRKAAEPTGRITAPAVENDGPSARIARALRTLGTIGDDDPRAPAAEALAGLLETVVSAIEDLGADGSVTPSVPTLNAAEILVGDRGDRAILALADAIGAVAER